MTQTIRTVLQIGILMLAFGCGGKKDEGGGGGDGKATAEQCKRAYDHLAELNAKKNGGTAAEWLDTQKGNIESCPKMVTSKGIDCMNAMTEWDMMKCADCNEVK